LDFLRHGVEKLYFEAGLDLHLSRRCGLIGYLRVRQAGAEGEDNVQRLEALLRRLPFAPLPGGGLSLVQPIHQSDVTRALLAAARHDWTGPQAMVIAGPEPVPYRDFLAAVVRAAGLGSRPVLPLPLGLLGGLAWCTRIIPGLPAIGADEIRRLTEDKAFDIAPMRSILGVLPIPLEQGLALTFAPTEKN
jgi:nucleoside-diphosphate-sugar epimerase